MRDFPAFDEAAEERAARTIFFDKSGSEVEDRVVYGMDYQVLLHGDPEFLAQAIGQMREAISNVASNTAETNIGHLLRAIDWRFHNIACLALLSRRPTANLLQELWSAIKKGSWTSPQLAATAALVDQDFDKKALELIGSRSTYFKSILSLAALLQRNRLEVEIPMDSQSIVKEAQELDMDDSADRALERFRSIQSTESAT